MTKPSASRWRRRLTIPNALSIARILAAPVLVGMAVSGDRNGAVVVFVLMSLSDWIDGKIARVFDQRSDIGPGLDSAADMLMYGSLFASITLLDGDRLVAELPWFASPVLCYLAAGGVSLRRFARWPHHHTRMAKISWGLMLVGAVAFLGDWSAWPLRIALVSATLASLQSIMITRILPEWREDVLSVSEARRIPACPKSESDCNRV